MSLSLNAGAELDGEDPVEDPTSIALALDIDKLDSEAVSLEERTEDLVGLARAIRATSGMSQSFAMEAEKLLPGFGGVPVGYYTKDPSITRYKLSLEEITKGIWELIQKMAKIVRDAVLKLISWITGKADPKDDGDDNKNKEREEVLKEGAKGNEETAKSVSRLAELYINAHFVFKDKDGNPVDCHTWNDFVKYYFIKEDRYGRVSEFLNNPKPIYLDIVNGGDYSKMMKDAFRYVEAATTALRVKSMHINKTMNNDTLGNGSLKDAADNTERLTKVSSAAVFDFKGSKITIEDLNSRFNIARQVAMQEHPGEVLSIDKALLSLSGFFSTNPARAVLIMFERLTDTLRNTTKHLDALEDMARDLTMDGVLGANSEGVGQHIRDSIIVVRQEVAGVSRLIVMIDEYMRNVIYLNTQIAGVFSEIMRRVVIQAHKDGLEVHPEWTEHVNHLAETARALTRKHWPG